MRLLSKHTARRAIVAAVILVSSTGLSGCVVPQGVNLADEYGDWAGFCGFFQNCGSDSDTNRGGSQTATGTSSDSSSSSSASTGGTGSATPAGGN